jgi:hypothetical protein
MHNHNIQTRPAAPIAAIAFCVAGIDGTTNHFVFSARLEGYSLD